MTDICPPSPKRRRILSSMNPEGPTESSSTHSPAREQATAPPESRSRPSSSRSEAAQRQGKATTGVDQVPETHASTESSRPTKFRFKSSKSKHSSSRHHHRSSRHGEDGRDSKGDDNPSSSRRNRHHHRHRRRHRSPEVAKEPEDNPAIGEAGVNANNDGGLSPNAAFRESLFDAMADDEGAAYWEGVYGQPIHVYSRPDGAGGAPQAQGELDRMTDDEYAAYVRRRMWEKTHAGLLEDRARREEERKRKDKESQEAMRLAEEIERSLRRGEERRTRKVWKTGWERYQTAWSGWDGGIDGLPWPTRNGTQDEVGIEGEVSDFFEKGLNRDEIGGTESAAKLREERVRWHPDKIQQRLGGNVQAAVMKDVTAIFQTIDRLWNDTRSKA